MRNLLHAEGGGFQHRLDFQYHVSVDDVLGGGACHALYYCGEVAWADAELVGIETHFTLAGAVFVYHLDELLEQLFLAADAFGMAVEEQPVGLVVDMQQEALQVVADDLFAEAVAAVGVQFFYQQHHPLDGAQAFFGQGDGGRIVQKAEERRFQTVGNLPEKGMGEDDVLGLEVRACPYLADEGAGQEYGMGVRFEGIFHGVDFDAGFSL